MKKIIPGALLMLSRYLPLGICLVLTCWMAGGGCHSPKKETKELLLREDRLGVCTHFNQGWFPEKIMPLIANLGVGWIRDEISWKEMEPTPGLYRIPEKTSRWLAEAKKYDLKVLLILNFSNPIYQDPYDPQAYAKAAAWLVGEVGDKVAAIEILNEPNNFGFRQHYGGEWHGKEKDGGTAPYVKKYVELLNAAAPAIKAVNPRIKVVGLGAPAPATFRMIALGIAPEVDGMTDHPYPKSMPEFTPYAATAETLARDGIATADHEGTYASQIALFREQAKKYRGPREIWQTEWGYSTLRKDEKNKGLSEEAQAVYIMRRTLEGFAEGVDHAFIYNFRDNGDDPFQEYENFGLLTRNLSPKQAYFCLRRVLALCLDQRVMRNDVKVIVAGEGRIKWKAFTDEAGTRTVVAFWLVSRWPSKEAVPVRINLPVDKIPGRVLIYDPLWAEFRKVSAEAPVSGVISYEAEAVGSPRFLVLDREGDGKRAPNEIFGF